MDFLVAGFAACLLTLNVSWFLMLSRVRRREPDLPWWTRSTWKVCSLYRRYYPGSKVVWLHWIAMLGADLFFVAGCYLESFQRR